MPKEIQSSLQTHVNDILSKYPDADTCWVAYSGGLDSCVLLHVLAGLKNKIKPKLVAVYINHGLSPNAEQWQDHCQQVCENFAIEFRSYAINISHKGDQGIEALAREKRYEIFDELMKPNDLLLTAHHLNDQVETTLLQLLRGSGPDGLVGMPHARAFSNGTLLRPLLDFSREEIHQYALNESLHWIEDESNHSDLYDRNYLRNKILPELFTRWPGTLKTLQRATSHQSDAKNLIDEIATIDLLAVGEDNFVKINLERFDTLSDIRKKYVLREWIKKNQLQMPNTQIIDRIIGEVICAQADRNPGIEWQGAEVRRYRGYLYIMSALPAYDAEATYVWKLSQILKLPSGSLKAVAVANYMEGTGIKKNMGANDCVEVRYRQGGEKIRLSDREHTHDLKKLYQEHGILPWLRERIPLIYYENKLIAVGDLWVERDHAAAPSEPAWQIEWEWAHD